MLLSTASKINFSWELLRSQIRGKQFKASPGQENSLGDPVWKIPPTKKKPKQLAE
jgi:hypothetical protein